jgi:hypothetical protein
MNQPKRKISRSVFVEDGGYPEKGPVFEKD